MPGNQAATLRFFGGAGTVTGSKYLVSLANQRVLLDCGLFQGLKELRLRNWQSLPFDVKSLDAVLLSHAHIDHSGALPLLVRQGFRGTIYCTSGTADLLRVMLPDTARLQEEEAERANRYGYTKHAPAKPLYTMRDAQATLRRLVVRKYDQRFQVTKEIAALFRRAGHILGAATVEVQLGQGKPLHLVFSGDLGRCSQPILRDPERIRHADVLLLESTYGDRVHPSDPFTELTRIVHETVKRRGVLLVPAFAVGRTQLLVWMLRQLEEAQRIPVLAVYLDSPMASDVTDLYNHHTEDHDSEMLALRAQGKIALRTQRYQMAQTVEESKALNRLDGPCIIISASGMATGGRVLHHLRMRLPDPSTTVLLVGFQAVGTRGRALQEGATTLHIHGEDVPVKARVESLDGLSAHADREELLRWLSGFASAPRMTYLVHGEPEQAAGLAQTIQKRLGWQVRPALDGEEVRLPDREKLHL